ncbi:MAG: acyltransferase [Alphaproteobacteria bacterium]|nr:acyltransferase [Alphaproteobacteria bacterium]MBV8410715.1 acyltransferase [Alphaproteobacteria bacterium]
MTNAPRLAGLDALRGIAAAAVMLHHHGQYYDVLFPGRSPLTIDLGPGHFGVELFFIISGLVILMTIARKESALEFGISRTVRLMPAFLAALVLATTILALAPLPPPFASPSPRQFLANITMASDLFGERNVDLPYWTLTYELVFYALMALLLRLDLLRFVELFGIVVVAGGCLFMLVVDERLHHRLSIVLLVHYSNFFLIGICLYRVLTRQARAITAIALTFAVATTALGGGERAFFASGYVYFPLTVALAGLVWLAASKQGSWLSWRPLVYLGKISYPLYLIHVVVGFQIISFGVGHGWSTLQGVVMSVAACLVLAMAMHHVVELPGQRLLRGLAARWIPAPAVVRGGS